jgi:hypothetical protein
MFWCHLGKIWILPKFDIYNEVLPGLCFVIMLRMLWLLYDTVWTDICLTQVKKTDVKLSCLAQHYLNLINLGSVAVSLKCRNQSYMPFVLAGYWDVVITKRHLAVVLLLIFECLDGTVHVNPYFYSETKIHIRLDETWFWNRWLCEVKVQQCQFLPLWGRGIFVFMSRELFGCSNIKNETFISYVRFHLCTSSLSTIKYIYS